MKQKILFLDIDGPMIPGRAHNLPGQRSETFVKQFDPVAVSIINWLCDECGWRVVLHTSWIRLWGEAATRDHCIKQGIKEKFFHKDICDEGEPWRYTRVDRWLNDHLVDHYVILDDEPYALNYDGESYTNNIADHLIVVDFEDGILTGTVNKILGGDWRDHRSRASREGSRTSEAAT